MSEKISLRMLTVLAVLIAMQIVLSRFASISAWNVRIGLGFIPVAVSGILFGPAAGALVGAISDVIGAILFPSGAFFPGVTLKAALSGALYGFVFSGFFRKRLAKGMPRQIVPPLIAALIDQWILGFLLNTYFISVLYGSSFKGLLAVRSVQAAIMCVVQAILLYVLQKILMRPDIRKVLSRQH